MFRGRLRSLSLYRSHHIHERQQLRSLETLRCNLLQLILVTAKYAVCTILLVFQIYSFTIDYFSYRTYATVRLTYLINEPEIILKYKWNEIAENLTKRIYNFRKAHHINSITYPKQFHINEFPVDFLPTCNFTKDCGKNYIVRITKDEVIVSIFERGTNYDLKISCQALEYLEIMFENLRQEFNLCIFIGERYTYDVDIPFQCRIIKMTKTFVEYFLHSDIHHLKSPYEPMCIEYAKTNYVSKSYCKYYTLMNFYRNKKFNKEEYLKNYKLVNKLPNCQRKNCREKKYLYYFNKYYPGRNVLNVCCWKMQTAEKIYTPYQTNFDYFSNICGAINFTVGICLSDLINVLIGYLLVILKIIKQSLHIKTFKERFQNIGFISLHIIFITFIVHYGHIYRYTSLITSETIKRQPFDYYPSFTIKFSPSRNKQLHISTKSNYSNESILKFIEKFNITCIVQSVNYKFNCHKVYDIYKGFDGSKIIISYLLNANIEKEMKHLFLPSSKIILHDTFKLYCEHCYIDYQLHNTIAKPFSKLHWRRFRTQFITNIFYNKNIVTKMNEKVLYEKKDCLTIISYYRCKQNYYLKRFGSLYIFDILYTNVLKEFYNERIRYTPLKSNQVREIRNKNCGNIRINQDQFRYTPMVYSFYYSNETVFTISIMNGFLIYQLTHYVRYNIYDIFTFLFGLGGFFYNFNINVACSKTKLLYARISHNYDLFQLHYSKKIVASSRFILFTLYILSFRIYSHANRFVTISQMYNDTSLPFLHINPYIARKSEHTNFIKILAENLNNSRSNCFSFFFHNNSSACKSYINDFKGITKTLLAEFELQAKYTEVFLPARTKYEIGFVENKQFLLPRNVIRHVTERGIVIVLSYGVINMKLSDDACFSEYMFQRKLDVYPKKKKLFHSNYTSCNFTIYYPVLLSTIDTNDDILKLIIMPSLGDNTIVETFDKYTLSDIFQVIWNWISFTYSYSIYSIIGSFQNLLKVII